MRKFTLALACVLTLGAAAHAHGVAARGVRGGHGYGHAAVVLTPFLPSVVVVAQPAVVAAAVAPAAFAQADAVRAQSASMGYSAAAGVSAFATSGFGANYGGFLAQRVVGVNHLVGARGVSRVSINRGVHRRAVRVNRGRAVIRNRAAVRRR